MTTQITAAASGQFLLGGDRRVHRLGFGAMRLAAGGFTGPARDPQTGITVLRQAVEAGVDHIDTAGFYRRGDVAANELIRTALAPYPDELLIATKVGPLLVDGRPGGQAGPEQLRALVTEDLRTLGLDRFELVYLRVGGMSGPGGESVADRFAVLAALREEGLIRHLGVSNVDVVQLDEALGVAPIAAVQNQFHVHRGDDADVLARCVERGIAYVPFFPLGGGFDPIEHDRLASVAARHGATTSQVALAWLLATSPNMLAIPGTGSPAHLAENVAAAGLRLDPAELAELTAP
ncbi:Predicted oxidoreductase [Actinacidiphila yanglinensis]|uniref:Predicted oxidoreductase n=1 Tax=Actinacidiphila yanglinensis TaxID=310779 RepID=A0A1H5VS71_9ACTN|nr:oxidoreductase [Actinacidiphila yanglinensis]SEF89818.1 Predicted oxidoreductase [Actinacidiphila yanglinensis]